MNRTPHAPDLGIILKLRGIGLTQAEIAEILGTSQQTVSRKLRDLRAAARVHGDPLDFATRILQETNQ